jgi:hypothetical protein
MNMRSRRQVEADHRCPSCGAVGVPILYGLVGSGAAEDARVGAIALGGCCITSESPRWECPACGHRWDGANT